MRELGLTVLMVLSLATAVLGQGPAGSVALLEGQATVVRIGQAPVALKFGDRILAGEQIATGAESLLRVLIGGRAVITVRELSSVTITEEPSKIVISLSANPPTGSKVAFMAGVKPGELHEVRTPNAVVQIARHLMIVEYSGTTTIVDNMDGTDVRGATIVDGAVGPFRMIPAGQKIGRAHV